MGFIRNRIIRLWGGRVASSPHHAQIIFEETTMKRASALLTLTVLSVLGPLAPLREARADPYPARPVKVIVPGPAGGGLDVIARIMVQSLSETGRGQFYIENLPGAGGAIGTGTAANAPADGYTMLLTNQDFV